MLETLEADICENLLSLLNQRIVFYVNDSSLPPDVPFCDSPRAWAGSGKLNEYGYLYTGMSFEGVSMARFAPLGKSVFDYTQDMFVPAAKKGTWCLNAPCITIC